ncbi:MAG: HPr family phosphocarrier protein [bacterium]
MKLSGEQRETRDFVLRNRYGMHVRPAGLFAKVAARFNAEVQVEKDGSVVSGKSIMALMTLDAACGSMLRVSASGPQAREVLDELQGLIARKFDIPDEQ